MEKIFARSPKDGKEKKRPLIKFRVGLLLFAILGIVVCCFAAYMLEVNINPDDFLNHIGAYETPSDAENSEVQISIVNPVPLAPPRNDAYLSDCELITDSSLKELGKAKVIEYTNDYVYVKNDENKKIYAVYICINGGFDSARLEKLSKTVPKDIKVYIMPLPPVSGDNKNTDIYNSALLTLANKLGLNFVDINSALKGTDGKIKSEYVFSDGSLTDKAYSKLADYVLSHTRS